jgi:hypothetical protein
MTNHLSHRSERGPRADARRPIGRRRTGVLLALVALLVSAWPAFAAEIVEVRVGRHPTFTRVVFELDRPAGYRIERSDPASGPAELVVSLEAASIPRSVSSQKTFIDHVEVEPQGGRSVAHLRLTQEGLRLKEMILANPPRIVLDLMSDAPATPVAKAGKAKSAPAPVAPDSEAETFDEVVAGIEPKAAPAEPEVAKPVEVAKAESPAPTPAAEGPEADPIAEEARLEDLEDEALAAENPEYAVALDEDEPIAPMDDVVADEPSTSVPIEADEPIARAEAKPPMPGPAAQPAPKRPAPMVAKSTTTDDQGGGWLTWALAGAGALVVLGGGLFIARRRGEASGADAAEWDDDEGDDADAAFAEAAADVNPFASADEPTVLGGPDEDTVVAPMMDSEDTTLVSVPDEEKESESLFGDAEEKDMDDMEVISRDQVNESLGGPAMAPVMGGGSEEMQQMFAEMTRRLEALEARCDELVDARDRLERQVAAQTEELRVQRAAIARTQRAVRNLGRGESESEGEEPTEPALRDPNQ